MFKIITFFLCCYASLCQAELVALDDAELSKAAAQGSITISIDAGSGSDLSIEPTNTSADGSVIAFTDIQTATRDSDGVIDTNNPSPIDVVLDISGDNGSGDPAIVATIKFPDVGADSTALKIGGWKLADSTANLSSTTPSLGSLFITDVTGSAVISVGFR